jgi:hypothetical protein
MRLHCGEDWPGAVVLLTHGTRAPEGFENEGSESTSVIGATRTWKDVGLWLANDLAHGEPETTHCALASDFTDFLEEKGLMTQFMTSRDLAATALFVPAYRSLHHTFKTAISEVALKYPRSRGGNIRVEFYSDLNSYCGWYYINSKLNLPSTRFYIAVGIWFPDGASNAELTGIPAHEPFFFVFIADDNEHKKSSDLLTKIPEGWVEIYDGYLAAVTRTVGSFEADPDMRAQSLVAWAQREVDRALAFIPHFETVVAEKIREEPES